MKPEQFPIHCACGAPRETYEEAVNRGGLKEATNHRCQYLGGVKHSFNGRWLSCGCSRIYLYPCQHFNELVTLNAVRRPNKIDTADDVRRGISDFHPQYRGRTCQGCEAFKSIEPPKPEVPQYQPLLSPAKDGWSGSNLVVLTAYFNPQHSTNRRNNWFAFSQSLLEKGIQLLTIEGVRVGDDPNLPERSDVQRIYFEDILWHKERLLNIAIRNLPKEVDAVAWVDADLLWPCPDLEERILSALAYWPVIQPWSTCVLLDANNNTQLWMGRKKSPHSTGSYNHRRRVKDGNPSDSHPGFAWAARRSVIDEIGGLYDRHITGGGDTAMALGFFGNFKSTFLDYDRMSLPMFAHWNSWAMKAHSVIKGQVGFIESEIQHLYHGEIADRGYRQRWRSLAEQGYNPLEHITHEPNGVLAWTDAATLNLRSWVSNYLLHTRKEDGR